MPGFKRNTGIVYASFFSLWKSLPPGSSKSLVFPCKYKCAVHFLDFLLNDTSLAKMLVGLANTYPYTNLQNQGIFKVNHLL